MIHSDYLVLTFGIMLFEEKLPFYLSLHVRAVFSHWI